MSSRSLLFLLDRLENLIRRPPEYYFVRDLIEVLSRNFRSIQGESDIGLEGNFVTTFTGFGDEFRLP